MILLRLKIDSLQIQFLQAFCQKWKRLSTKGALFPFMDRHLQTSFVVAHQFLMKTTRI